MARYAEDSGKRLQALREKSEEWWEEIVSFFDVPRSRGWVMTRRIPYAAQHRGQLLAMLRVLGRDIHSTYGPTADTGGLMQHRAPTIYAYPSLEALLEGERAVARSGPCRCRVGTQRPSVLGATLPGSNRFPALLAELSRGRFRPSPEQSIADRSCVRFQLTKAQWSSVGSDRKTAYATFPGAPL